MNTTLYASGLLDTPAGLAAAALIGLLFGFFLEQAGFASSRRLTGVFYLRDMTVVKVMFTAVVTALIGYQYAVMLGVLQPSGIYVLDTWWGAQIVGGLLFGVGFVMGGFCPGTALAGVASLKGDALVFLVGAALGSILFNELYPVIRPLYEGFHAGPIALTDILRLSSRSLTVLFAVAAVGVFALCSWLERRAGALPAPAAGEGRRNTVLAALLLLAALGTFTLRGAAPLPTDGAAAPAGRPAGPPAESGLLERIDLAGDHIDADTLADLILRGGKELLVVDLRAPGEYAHFHIRSAVNIPLDRLDAARGRLPRSGLVVLYSNGTTHAAQAWLVLTQAGWTNVRVLTDGILGFWRDCLTPPSLMPGLDEAAARAASSAFAARRAFFLQPLTPTRPAPAAQAAAGSAPASPAVTNVLKAAGLDGRVVETAWLAERLGDAGIKILDVRAKSTDYTTKHIPGAIYLNLENIRSTVEGIPNTVVPAEDLARAFGRLGLAAGDTVIVYSDQLRDATLVALALERVGHASFAVLHGGWNAWAAEGRPADAGLPRIRETTYRPRRGADTFTASLAEVKRASESGKAVILDVRPADYYAGRKSDELRPGHIPGAVNREFSKDLAAGSAFWLDEPTLRKAYEGLGIRPDTPVIVHCRTGHQASQTWYLLKHVLGVKNVKWFDGSWLAWAADPGLPAVLGDTP